MTAPALSRENPDGSRSYVHPVTEEIVPSVTTVLDMIAKPGLAGGAARVAAEYSGKNWQELSSLPLYERVALIRDAHEQDWGKKRDLGTAVHEVIDKWAKGIPCPDPPKETVPYLNSFISFMMEVRPRFMYNEVTVWSHKYGYAGTADWIAEVDKRIWLGDNKTGRRVHEEAALQLTALGYADCIIREDGTEEALPGIDEMMVLHIRPRSWKLIDVHHDRWNFKAFLAARELHEWTHTIKPYVFGGTP